MSVKDKIAMWNSMGANNSNNSTPPPPKFSSTFIPKPSATETPATGHLSAKPAELNKTPSNNEKKWEVDTGSVKTPSWIKSQESGQKPTPVITSKPVVVPSSTGESEQILKPSEIKKKLESMSAGKGLYFAPSPPTAPRSEQTLSNNSPAVPVNYEIEKGSIAVNVKQNAEKLNQFYQKQHMLQARKAQQPAKEHSEVEKSTEEHKHESTPHGQSQKEIHHESQPLFKHTQSHTHEAEIKKQESKHTQHPHIVHPKEEHSPTIEHKPQTAHQTAGENKPDEMSLATRIKRRKMQQASFDSDDD